MPRESSFGKKQILELIQVLKIENITSISAYEIVIILGKHFPNHDKSNSQLSGVINYYKNLFEQEGIEIYVYREKEKEKGQNLIKETLLYFKDDLKKTIITAKEIQVYMKEKYDFKLHLNSTFYETYKVDKFMQELGMSFSNTDEQKKNSLNILKRFSKSDIVERYKKENKQFTLPKIHSYVKDEISIASLYNYSNEIINLGIPLKTNRIIVNKQNYDEKDIISKLSSYTIKQGQKRIYAGELSKYSWRLSLPTLGYEKILEYKEYILDMFGIEVLDHKNNEKLKIENTVEDNINYLKKEANIKISYVDVLPNINEGNDVDFISVNQKEYDLKELWMQYLKFYLLELSKVRSNVKNELIDESDIRIDTQNKKIFFLLHDDLHISSLTIEDIIKLSLKNVLSSEKVYGIHRQNLFIGFILYLYTKNILLLSIEFVIKNYYKTKKAQSEILLVLKENYFIKLFNMELEANRLNTKEKKVQRAFFFFLTTLNLNLQIKDINESHFYSFELVDKELTKRLKKIFNKLGADLDISNNTLQFTEDYYSFMKQDNYKDFILICNSYMDKKVKLKQTKTPNDYFRRVSSKIVKFLEFMVSYHKGIKLDKKNLEQIFDYPESRIYTYQEYVDGLSLSESTKSSRLNIFVEIFANTKGYESVCTKSKIPSYNVSSFSSREAIEDDEIIYKINDIVTNRPPKSDYFRNHVVDMDMSWWKHLDKVRPFEPLLIKLHLSIPVRGGTIRLIDRDKLLQFDNYGNIKGFHFVSDKNKKRRDPFVVPNIWKSELDFLIKLVEYSREYFPNLKKIYPDDTTLKEGVLPLFPDSEGIKAYTSSQHHTYWTKVLIQAQMEFFQEGKNEYNFVFSDDVEFPTSMEEFDRLTSEDLKSFKKIYDIHTLRHTGITKYIRAGMPLELLRMLSGHSGFNTILTIYYHVNQEELVNNWLLKNNIDITDDLDMHRTTDIFIKKEFIEEIESINPERILEILKKYSFFNLTNRTLSFKEEITLESISKTDPKFWKARNGGICTRQQCPDGLNEKCSLCSYFISNYMFLPDIGLNMQLSMAKVKKYNDMVNKNREQKQNEKNSRLKSLIKEQIEEFFGWLEILELANNSYKETIDGNNIKLIPLEKSNENKSTYSIHPSLDINHGYLDTLVKAYQKKLNDDETVVDITNIIANKLIRYHAKNNTYHEIEGLENEEIVKSFLPKYEKISEGWHNNSKSRKELENLLNLLDNKNEKLEYKNENTFLTE